MELLLALTILSPPLIGALLHMKQKSQREVDGWRDTYELVFPTGLAQDRIEAAIRSTSSGLRDNRFKGDPSIVYEVTSTSRGIRHFVRVPSAGSEYLMEQLERHVVGLDARPLDEPIDTNFTYGVDLAMSDPARQLRIHSVQDHATKVLTSLVTSAVGEEVRLQWITLYTGRAKVIESTDRPIRSSKGSLLGAVLWGTEASKEEVADRKQKVSDQNFMVVGRIAAKAKTEGRAKELVNKAMWALTSENHNLNRIKARPIPTEKLDAVINNAWTPLNRRLQLTVSELVGVMAWPIGTPQIPGLVTGSARRFAATDVVPREGIRLGHSNISGRARPIAVSPERLLKHTFVGGRTGSGKSVMLSNIGAQLMDTGQGLFVIDATTGNSEQSVYNRVLNLVPPERADDVITLNISADADNPIGFNLLDQDSGLAIIDQIVGVFSQLYPDVKSGVAVRDLLYHGTWTLIEHGGLTFVDLAALISPRSEAEKQWSADVKASMKNPDIIAFWQRMKEEDARGTYSKALHNKLWQLAGRPEVKHIIGQNVSTLKIRDALANNKIVLISLAGLPKETAELMGSLLMSTIWHHAQLVKAPKPNGIILDEFQVSANIKDGLSDMLSRARQFGLQIIMATQYLDDPERVSRSLQTAILNSTSTRVIFETTSKEANIWIPEFGGPKVMSQTDFTGIPLHNAIATIATDQGTSPPITIKALAPLEPTGMKRHVTEQSRRNYGRPVHQVQQEILERRRPKLATTVGAVDKPIGSTPYNPDAWKD